SGTVQVNEGDGELLRNFDSLGHGAQRAVQMALIRFLAERDKVRGESSSRKFLLIEEPELYLHPQAITFLSQALKKLSKGRYQIIFATHSPIMISPKDIGVTALIRKDDENGTYRQNTLNEAIDKVLDGKGIADKMFALENSSQLLFADSILLIEGKTEKKLIPKLFESYYDLSSFQTKVAFINRNEAPGVKNAAEILESMGLDYKILVDLDYCFNNAIDHEYLSGTEDAFNKGVNIIQSSTDELDIELDEDWPNSPKYLKSENYEKLVENGDFQKVIEELHSLLLDENIWIWQTGHIEVPLA